MKKNYSVKLFPNEIQGQINIPPSKSLSHRALICASLAKGKSIITNIMFSDDIKATMNALTQLGAEFEIDGDTVTVTGTRRLRYNNNPVNCNESGSTIRFLIPLFSLTNKKITFVGKESLIQRPQSIYQEIFDHDENQFEIQEKSLVVKGSIKPRNYFLEGDVSSQFFSGLMFSLPLLEEDSKIFITSTLESKSYIDLTIQTLELFGVEVQEIENGYFIRGNQQYTPANYRIEGDFSQAAFFLVGGAIGGAIKIDNLNHDSKQGDLAIIDIIKNMKGKVIYTENGFVTDQSTLYGTTIDLSDCPDLGPIVALLGALAKGQTTLTNINRLRLKESDRVESTVNTLSQLGANIKIQDEEIIIHGKNSLKGGVTVDSYNDHRIAMMAAIASTRCKEEITITRANAVNKSYPHFFEDLKQVGGKFVIKD